MDSSAGEGHLRQLRAIAGVDGGRNRDRDTGRKGNGNGVDDALPADLMSDASLAGMSSRAAAALEADGTESEAEAEGRAGQGTRTFPQQAPVGDRGDETGVPGADGGGGG